MVSMRPAVPLGVGAILLIAAPGEEAEVESVRCSEAVLLRVTDPAPKQGSVGMVGVRSDSPLSSVEGSFAGKGLFFWHDSEARVYQADDAKLVSTLEGQKGAVYAVAYRPDGKEVATAGFDGTVRLHDPATGKLIKEFVPVPQSAAGARK